MALLAYAYTDDFDMALAGLYHDVAEDTPHSLQEIADVASQRVAKLVDEVTKRDHPTLDKEDRHKMEMERLSSISPEGKTIKCADVIANIGSIQYKKDGAEKWIEGKKELFPLIENCSCPAISKNFQKFFFNLT